MTFLKHRIIFNAHTQCLLLLSMDLQFLTDFAASSGLLVYYEYVKPYLFSIFAALYLLYRLYERTKHLSQGDRTAAVPGSKVVDAISSQMFHSMVDAGGAETKLIVVDFYATWFVLGLY
jgi:hypothetical protein